MNRMSLRTLLPTLLLTTVLPASAHTVSAYLMPEAFDLKNPTVTVQSALTVEKFYQPSRNHKAVYHLNHPDGSRREVVPVAELSRYSVLELDAPLDGTYRLQAVGREPQVSEFAQMDGQWLRIRPAQAMAQGAANPPRPNQTAPQGSARNADVKPAGSPPPPRRFVSADAVPSGAARMSTRTTQMAELYLSRGAPGAAPAPTGQGFELVPLTTPNDVYVDSGFEFAVQMDGKPVPGLKFEMFTGSDGLTPGADTATSTVTTDARGRATARFAHPGVYLLTTRWPQEPLDATGKPVPQAIQYGLSLQVAP